MTTRRGFFKEFIGQLGVVRDEFIGVDNIPLNRLIELPDDIIEQIKPVFFPDKNWYFEDGVIFIQDKKNTKETSIKLNEIEIKALELFKEGVELRQVAVIINDDSGLPFIDVYPTVTSLFFKLASSHICHPLEVYKIDEIIQANKQETGK